MAAGTDPDTPAMFTLPASSAPLIKERFMPTTAALTPMPMLCLPVIEPDTPVVVKPNPVPATDPKTVRLNEPWPLANTGVVDPSWKKNVTLSSGLTHALAPKMVTSSPS